MADSDGASSGEWEADAIERRFRLSGTGVIVYGGDRSTVTQHVTRVGAIRSA